MSGYVYFILCGPLEAVKIGYTKNSPSGRLAELQTGCPGPLSLAAFFPGSFDDERRLHDAFSALHIHGEWFRFDHKLRDLVFYLKPDVGARASREGFENALNDVLLLGRIYPPDRAERDEYVMSGNFAPFGLVTP